MNDDLAVARDLRTAADYLRTHGWMQGQLFMPEAPQGARCLAGALLAATGELVTLGDCLTIENHCEALGFLLWRKKPSPRAQEFIGNWNDHPDRTLDEVLDRLESTALALEVRALAAEAQPVVVEATLVGVGA